MRFSRNGVGSISTSTRVIAIGAAALAATASAYAASPKRWVFDSPIITFGHRPSPRAPEPAHPGVHGDVRPAELRFTAYQADDSVIVAASGVNGRAGFETELCDVDRRDGHYVVTMHNRAARHSYGAACMTPFHVVASFRAYGRVNCIKVALGCETIEVPVVQAARIR